MPILQPDEEQGGGRAKIMDRIMPRTKHITGVSLISHQRLPPGETLQKIRELAKESQ